MIVAGDNGGLSWQDPEAVLVQCGDIPDRGPRTLVICSLISHLRSQGARIYTLLGNHDIAYLVAPDAAEQRRRIDQALCYMMDEDGRLANETSDVERTFLTQAAAISTLHRHELGGIIALIQGDVLFMHAEPVPGSFDPGDLDQLEGTGCVRLDPARHLLAHPAFWGRAYSCGTTDGEGGYAPRLRRSIPPARRYEPDILALHAAEPEVAAMYDRLRAMGITTIVHGHVPGPGVRRYRVAGIEHVNIDEAICGHYRGLFDPDDDGHYIPTGWQRRQVVAPLVDLAAGTD